MFNSIRYERNENIKISSSFEIRKEKYFLKKFTFFMIFPFSFFFPLFLSNGFLNHYHQEKNRNRNQNNKERNQKKNKNRRRFLLFLFYNSVLRDLKFPFISFYWPNSGTIFFSVISLILYILCPLLRSLVVDMKTRPVFLPSHAVLVALAINCFHGVLLAAVWTFDFAQEPVKQL